MPTRSLAALLAILALSATHAAAQPAPGYEITVTNVTRDQRFTPILGVTHDASVSLFTTGAAASAELATLAEEGDTGPLRALLDASAGVRETAATEGLLDAGSTATLRIQGRPGDRITLAAMLIPTNDAFFAVNGARLPRDFEPHHLVAPAYDAGSERNDELCASIPGPFFEECGGPGGGAAVAGGEEGFVHIHAGIHGIGDLDASQRDWRNPVALISIRRIR